MQRKSFDDFGLDQRMNIFECADLFGTEVQPGTVPALDVSENEESLDDILASLSETARDQLDLKPNDTILFFVIKTNGFVKCFITHNGQYEVMESNSIFTDDKTLLADTANQICPVYIGVMCEEEKGIFCPVLNDGTEEDRLPEYNPHLQIKKADLSELTETVVRRIDISEDFFLEISEEDQSGEKVAGVWIGRNNYGTKTYCFGLPYNPLPDGRTPEEVAVGLISSDYYDKMFLDFLEPGERLERNADGRCVVVS